MWYSFSQIDENIVKIWIDKLQQAQSIPDVEEREFAINALMLEYFNEFGMGNETYRESIYEPLSKIHQQSITDALAREKEKREETGEPELDLRDIYTFPQWIEWAKQNKGSLSEYDLPYLISALNESYSVYSNHVYQIYQKHREITDPSEKQFIINLKDSLQNEAFNTLGIDKANLSDPELWKIVSAGDFEKSLELVKRIDWLPQNDPNAEGTLLTFAINHNGIIIIAEVSDPMPVELQKQELEKFMNDVEKFIPNDWNKSINYIDGGDFQDIISGKLDKNIKVYRMMSDEEYESWLKGNIIPKGKYFALRRDLAVGTDFAGEGFKDIFSFVVNRSLMSGAEDNILISDVPLYLKNHQLLPVI